MIPARYWSPTKKLMVLGAMAGGKLVEDTATGNPLMFITDKAKPLKSLLIPFTPQQSGTGDPSPSNIRPIVAWDGLSVKHGGKNLLNPANRVASGNNVQYYRSGNRFLLKGGQTYTLSANVIPAQTTMYKGTNTTVASTTSASLTYTPTENVEVWFDFYVPNARLPEGGISAVYGMLEVGETATAYEPYVPITETDISFPSPVYGGTLDVVSGVLTVEYGLITLDDSVPVGLANWRPSDGTSAWLYSLSAVPSDTSTNSAICDKVKQNSYGSIYGGSVGVATNVISGDFGLAIRVPVENLTTEEAIHAYLAENPYHVAYKLATPQEIQLSPAQITALIGNNTIWSDADGSMTAVYLKKG